MDKQAQAEFKARRRQLMAMMDKDAIAILPASPVRHRSRDVEYPYRPDSDFLYLSGFSEPDAVIVLMPGRANGKYVLFCQGKDPKKELWDGRRAGQEQAISLYQADDSFPISDIDDIMPGLLEQYDKVYYTIGSNRDFDHRLLGWLKSMRYQSRSGLTPPDTFLSLEHLLHDMRLFKSRYELERMQTAADVTVEAHRRAMQVCKPAMMEYEIAAEMLHTFHQQGCEFAYPLIVGGGRNSCILHYTDNAEMLKDGDLLLIDAGAEYQGYAADVTRTFPVNGRFSGEQKAVYEVVLAAQQAAIDAVRPGAQWQEPHHAAVNVLADGIAQLKILKGSANYLVESGKYRQLYMHRTGHWLGMDVHDVGDYKVGEQWRELEPQMVLTVEPGLYIPKNTPLVDERWWDIGIRIEDDVLVTHHGQQVLTQAMPKQVKEIEELMNA